MLRCFLFLTFLLFLFDFFFSLYNTQLSKRSSSVSDLTGGSKNGLASLFSKKGGSAASLFGVFGDAMNSNELKKIDHTSKKIKKKQSAKDKRYQKKQANKRHQNANTVVVKDQKQKNSKLGNLVQKKKGKEITHPEFHMPGQHAKKKTHQMKRMETRQEFAGDDEWEKMMEDEKQKNKKKGRKKKK